MLTERQLPSQSRVTAGAYSSCVEPHPDQDEPENSPLIQALRELRAASQATRILIVAPGEAATAQVQTQLALAGELGVTVCGPDALLPNVLQPGSQLAASRVRTPGYWRELVALRYGAWTRGRQHELAIELFTADLTSADSALAAGGPVAQLLAEGSGEDTTSVVDSLSVRPPAVVLYGFDTEEAQVDLPSPLDVLIPQLETAGVTVTSARPPRPTADQLERSVMIASDRLAEIVAVTEAIEREGTGDVAIVVPDIGPYEHAIASALEGRNIATRQPRPERLDESPAGRWLRTFLLAVDDRFARPLFVDLLQQLATAGILPVEGIIEVDRISRRDWVLDSRHWHSLTADSRIDESVRAAMRVILQAGAALDKPDSASMHALVDWVAPLDPQALIRRSLQAEATTTNRTQLRRALAELGTQRGSSGVPIHRLSEAFGLTQSTVFVVGLDTTATYRNSQSAFEISRFKAKRRSWVWLSSVTPQLIVTAPAADLATSERLEISAWVKDLGVEPHHLPSTATLRGQLPGKAASAVQVRWRDSVPSRRLDADLTDHRWSPSQIDTFQRCPLQWALKSRLKLPRHATPESDDVFDPATRGTVVHSVLENQAKDVDRSFEELLREAIQEELAENALRDGDPLLEVTIGDLARRIQIGHRAIEAELALSGDVIEQQERSLDVVVQCGDRAVSFRGFIDRQIDSPAGRTVLDYKSSKKKTGVSDLSSAAASGQHLQLWLYAAMLEAVGDPAPAGQQIALAFPLAKLTGKQTPLSAVPVKAGDHRLRKVTDGVGRLIAAAENDELAVADQGYNSPCRFCDVADACPQRHRIAPTHDPKQFFGVRR